MALREAFREGLYDSERKPRLDFARNYFLGFSIDRDPDFEELTEFYAGWRDFIEYMVLQKQEDDLRVKGEVDKETFAVKCSKRGNGVYWWRVAKRIGFLKDLPDKVFFDPHSTDKISSILFVTLTYDIIRSRVRDAWDTMGEDFNNWIRNLRKKFGRISHLRCWEASKQGYPHIHALMIFHDYEFKVMRIGEKYRIAEKEEFEKSYHSFVDVQAVRELRYGVKYITKYLMKTKNESRTQNLTLAMCWLFRKRSFAVSGDLYELLQAEIKKSSKGVSVHVDLQGSKIDFGIQWIFIGVFSAKRLGINGNEWRKTMRARTDMKILSSILG
jgi:hypothetical protein